MKALRVALCMTPFLAGLLALTTAGLLAYAYLCLGMVSLGLGLVGVDTDEVRRGEAALVILALPVVPIVASVVMLRMLKESKL